MSRYATVCALGPPSGFHFQYATDAMSNEEALERMIDWWKIHLCMVWPHAPDLILLPEACDRYSTFSLSRRLDYYRFRGNQMRDFFAEEACAHHCYIGYSAAREQPDGSWRNATEIIARDGKTAGVYWKNYVTQGEYAAGIRYGTEAPLIQCDFGTVGCVTCFDLNFEELRKRYKAQHPDLLMVCCGPNAFDQRIWAYDCQAYLIAAMGGFLSSVMISPLGEVLGTSTAYHPFVIGRINLDREVIHLDRHWEKLEAIKQKYGSRVQIRIPDAFGQALLSSETDEFTAQDIMQEFGIIPWRDYYAETIRHREEHLGEL